MYLKSCWCALFQSRKCVSAVRYCSPPRAAVCVWEPQPPPGSGPQPCAGVPSGRTSTACREQEDSRTSSSSPGGASDQEKSISPSHLVRAETGMREDSPSSSSFWGSAGGWFFCWDILERFSQPVSAEQRCHWKHQFTGESASYHVVSTPLDHTLVHSPPQRPRAARRAKLWPLMERKIMVTLYNKIH